MKVNAAGEAVTISGQPVDLTYAAEKALPAVVHIKYVQNSKTQTVRMQRDPFEEFFSDPFGFFGSPNQGGGTRERQVQTPKKTATGSGVIISPDGTPRFLPVRSNLAAGLMEQFPYEAESIDLEPGTRIVAYTDGVTEAENDKLELYGEERLMEEMGRFGSDMDEQAIVEHIYHSVESFTGGHPQSDDITIMSLKV